VREGSFEEVPVSDVREGLRYTAEHEWVLVEDDEALIGITDYAQGELGDVVFIELPDIGQSVTHMEAFGTIEAVKAASDLYAPVTGEVIDVNQELAENPGLINASPYEDGWMIRVKVTDPGTLEPLMDAEKYKETIGE
jgi:glycine cleavage system H protein